MIREVIERRARRNQRWSAAALRRKRLSIQHTASSRMHLKSKMKKAGTGGN